MISNATLDRLSEAYRKGYRAGEAGALRLLEPTLDDWYGFACTDFIKGFEAGANDAHWGAVYGGHATDVRTRQSGYSFPVTA